MKRQPVVAIIGATAVGKTALSLLIAQNLSAEIISVDSRQIYRYMNIGTDKITESEKSGVIHHMLDIADPDENFTVSDFTRLASKTAKRIISRKKIPLFVGGTPFYYQALFHASMNEDLPSDYTVREKYETLANSQGAELLHMKLAEVDPDIAEKLHKNDIRRVSRALEIWELTGKAPSHVFKEGSKKDFGFDVLYIGLTRPREELFSRIEKRLKSEFNNGFPEEVKWLLDNGFDEKFNPLKGLGYFELIKYNRGDLTLEQALENSIARTKAFCRRQQTWFKKFEPVQWIDLSEAESKNLDYKSEILSLISNHLEKGSDND